MGIWRRTRTVIWAVVVALLAVALMWAPQFDLLNYYYCFVTSLFVGLGAFHIGLAEGRVLRLSDGPPRRATAAWGRAAAAGSGLALIALAVVSLNALRVRNCDYLGGLLFFGMGPLLGAWWAAAAGVLAGASSRRRWVGSLLFLGGSVAALAVPLWRFWAEPPVHQFHPVAGFFSGAVYDEVIEIGLPFLAYRLTNLLEIGAIVLALDVLLCPQTGRWRRPTLGQGGAGASGARARTLFAAVAVTAAALGWLCSATLGYRYDRGDIQRTLGGHLRTAHFDIYYPGGSPYERVAPRLAEECERHYAGLTSAFGREPETRTAVYVYPDAAAKRRLMGADRVYIAKPWLGEIHLNRLDVGARVIRHELVHALGRVCAGPPLAVPAAFGVIPHMGLIEGTAVALEERGGRLDVHQWSAAMRRLDIAPDMRRLMGPQGFWSTAAGKAYVTSGSFVRHLVERDPAPLCRLYHDADFEGAYGAPLEELVSGWEARLDDTARTVLDEEDLQLARDVFDRPSVFRKVCALEVARHEREAYRHHARREYGRAAEILTEVAGFDPDNPQKRYALAHALLDAGEIAAAGERFGEVAAADNASRVLRLRAQVGLADARWLFGDAAGAAVEYRALMAEPMGVDERRALEVKALVAESPLRAPLLADYLLRPLAPSIGAARVAAAARALPDDGLAQYLLARRRHLQGRFAEAVDGLRRALTDGALPFSVRREALGLLGRGLFVLERPAEAARPFDEALAMAQHEGEREELRAWLARVAWARR